MTNDFRDYEVNSERWLSLEDFDGEVWKDTEYKYYQISNYGRLKRLKHCTYSFSKDGVERVYHYKDKIDKFTINKLGYCRFRVHICHNKKKQVMAHRLVAIAFIPNPNRLPFINHKDVNPTNNCVENLEWCTHVYNCNYADANKKRSKSLIETFKDIRYTFQQYTKEGVFVKSYSGMTDLMNEGWEYFGVVHCATGRISTSQGFVWRKDWESFDVYGNNVKYYTGKRVAQMDDNNNVLRVFPNSSIAYRTLNPNTNKKKSSCIVSCCKGRRKSAYGYKWKFI